MVMTSSFAFFLPTEDSYMYISTILISHISLRTVKDQEPKLLGGCRYGDESLSLLLIAIFSFFCSPFCCVTVKLSLCLTQSNKYTRRQVAFTWDALEVFAVLVRDEWVNFLKVRFCRFILFGCSSVSL